MVIKDIKAGKVFILLCHSRNAYGPKHTLVQIYIRISQTRIDLRCAYVTQFSINTNQG